MDIDNIAKRLIIKPPKREDAIPAPDWKTENWVKDGDLVDETKGEDEAKTIELDSSDILEVAVDVKPDPGVKAKRFVELVEGGFTKWEAARMLGTTISKLMEAGDTRGAVKKLIEDHHIPNAVRKEMVRSALNKVLMKNIDGNTPREQKLALEATKQIASDPDVGLNVPPQQIGISIDIGKLGPMLTNLKPIEGLEDLLEAEIIKDEEDDGK